MWQQLLHPWQGRTWAVLRPQWVVPLRSQCGWVVGAAGGEAGGEAGAGGIAVPP